MGQPRTAINIEYNSRRERSLLQELSFGAWGDRRNPAIWRSFTGTPPEPLFDRGFTGHEHLYAFGLINMNGRMYDPLVSRMLSPDNFIQAPDFSQSFNRYSYCYNNPLVYIDPDGEWVNLVVGAFIGGTMNWMMNGGEFTWDGLKHFGVGALAGALSAGVGVGIQTALSGASFWAGFVDSSQGISTILSVGYTSSFANGTLAGAGASFSSGFITGTGNALIQGKSFDQAIGYGLEAGGWGALSGGLIGGVAGGIDAVRDGRNFLDGSYVYKSPINNNFGTQNGECALRCLEEFSSSYGMSEYDFNYWLEQNDGKLGVHATKVEGLIDNTGIFQSDRIIPQSNINVLAESFTNDKRVLMGFKTASGGEHAVMVSKVKIWSSGRYRVYFKETSPVRIAPYSSTNLYKVPGAGFWTFYH